VSKNDVLKAQLQKIVVQINQLLLKKEASWNFEVALDWIDNFGF